MTDVRTGDVGLVHHTGRVLAKARFRRVMPHPAAGIRNSGSAGASPSQSIIFVNVRVATLRHGSVSVSPYRTVIETLPLVPLGFNDSLDHLTQVLRFYRKVDITIENMKQGHQLVNGLVVVRLVE